MSLTRPQDDQLPKLFVDTFAGIPANSACRFSASELGVGTGCAGIPRYNGLWLSEIEALGGRDQSRTRVKIRAVGPPSASHFANDDSAFRGAGGVKKRLGSPEPICVQFTWKRYRLHREYKKLISQKDFFKFIQIDNFRRAGRPDYLAYRSRAAAVLAYCAGLWFPEVMALRREHWMPNSEACVVIDANAEYARRRIPASPAVQWAVQRFLAEGLAAAKSGLLFDCDGGLPLKQEIRNAIRKSPLGSSSPGSGELVPPSRKRS